MNTKHFYLKVLIVVLSIFPVACQKNNVDTSSLYLPTSADVTGNATLPELQEGRILYIDNCARCHSLYSPDNYTPTQWKGILNNMAPRTAMSASDILLVTKYLSRGKQ
jgi:hypothetical protein